jgi:hypothetical protein
LRLKVPFNSQIEARDVKSTLLSISAAGTVELSRIGADYVVSCNMVCNMDGSIGVLEACILINLSLNSKQNDFGAMEIVALLMIIGTHGAEVPPESTSGTDMSD